jgi:hypothetical protein
MARNAEDVLRGVREGVDEARAMVANVQKGVTSGAGMRSMLEDLRVTIGSSRDAMSNLADTTEALKRSFLVRGYFEDRGYYDLKALTAAEYRAGALAGRHREPIKVWLRADLLFEPVAPVANTAGAQQVSDVRVAASETLSADGRIRIDRAMAELLTYPRDTPLIIEGYASAVTRDDRFLRAAERTRQVLDYLVVKYGLASNRAATMPLVDESDHGPQGSAWDGVALTMWVDRRALAESGN